MPEQPAPLAEAIELMCDAAQGYLDGPLAYLREAAQHAAQPTYDSDTAAADATGYYLRLARAWWGGFNAAIDVIAVLGVPPGDVERFEVPIPPVPVPSTARVVNRTWTWLLDPEPEGVAIQVGPPVVLQPGTTSVCLRVTPLVLEPSWDVELEIAPIGSGQGTIVPARLDANSRQPTTGP